MSFLLYLICFAKGLHECWEKACRRGGYQRRSRGPAARRADPQWASLPLAPVPSAGTDNALYRLGADMVVRLPRIDWAVGQAEKERQWLPKLAPLLPLAVPVQLALQSRRRQ
jgi:hypothetical protein